MKLLEVAVFNPVLGDDAGFARRFIERDATIA